MRPISGYSHTAPGLVSNVACELESCSRSIDRRSSFQLQVHVCFYNIFLNRPYLKCKFHEVKFHEKTWEFHELKEVSTCRCAAFGFRQVLPDVVTTRGKLASFGVVSHTLFSNPITSSTDNLHSKVLESIYRQENILLWGVDSALDRNLINFFRRMLWMLDSELLWGIKWG